MSTDDQNQQDQATPEGVEVAIYPVAFGAFDAEGRLLRIGVVPSNHLEDVIANQDPQGVGEYVKVGTFDFPVHAAAKKSWAMERAEAYPPLADFADAMYWAAKGDMSKLNAYHAKVEAVKMAIPKTVTVDSSYVYHKP